MKIEFSFRIPRFVLPLFKACGALKKRAALTGRSSRAKRWGVPGLASVEVQMVYREDDQ